MHSEGQVHQLPWADKFTSQKKLIQKLFQPIVALASYGHSQNQHENIDIALSFQTTKFPSFQHKYVILIRFALMSPGGQVHWPPWEDLQVKRNLFRNYFIQLWLASYGHSQHQHENFDIAITTVDTKTSRHFKQGLIHDDVLS